MAVSYTVARRTTVAASEKQVGKAAHPGFAAGLVFTAEATLPGQQEHSVSRRTPHIEHGLSHIDGWPQIVKLQASRTSASTEARSESVDEDGAGPRDWLRARKHSKACQEPGSNATIEHGGPYGRCVVFIYTRNMNMVVPSTSSNFPDEITVA